MATNRPHVQLNTRQQRDAPQRLHFNYGPIDDEEEPENRDPDYARMAQEFRGLLGNLRRDVLARVQQRNAALPVGEHIDYIQILFQSQFIISDFYGPWLSEFGLLGTHISKFGHEILFAVTDRRKFQFFMDQIDRFIQKYSGGAPTIDYEEKVTFIQSFKLLTTADMLRFGSVVPIMNVQLIDDAALPHPQYTAIRNSLQQYLQDRGLLFRLRETTHHLEIEGATAAQIEEIAQNFDIVYQVTAALATVIRPSEFGQPQRSYGFEISNAAEDLPIIGIVDTGISNQTPLGAILIDDARFNLTATSPFLDEADHGTGVAALASLGRAPYASGFRGAVRADAKLLSIKILGADAGFLSQAAVVDLLYQAKARYPPIKVFVLTVCYETPKAVNEDYSTYAYALDQFAHQTDSIVFICTSNNNQAAADNIRYDLHYFAQDRTNLCPPAESMNNMTIGAAAGSLRPGAFLGVSDSGDFPALYSRKGHIDLAALFSAKKINKHYFKPDLIECGGDYEFDAARQFFSQGLRASMQILSADQTQSFYDNIGTSYATPLSANPAAQVHGLYPGIRAQSIKALLINGASLELTPFPKPQKKLQNRIAGHGLPNGLRSLYSNDNVITFLIEDLVTPEEVNIYPVHFPEYLTTIDLGKSTGILRVTATLCFSFDPLLTHQLAYCPIYMGFSFFRNQSGDEILASEKNTRSLLRNDLRWSQSARFVRKPAPPSNVQKVSFLVSKDLLAKEGSTFKLAVNCRISRQLIPGTERAYQIPHPFSLTFTVEENLKPAKLTGRLYSEMLACNAIENIARIAAQAEAEGEA
jgi:Subtilase family